MTTRTAKTSKTAKTTTSTMEPAMRIETTTTTTTALTADYVKTLSGEPLKALYREVVGEEPNPKAPVVALRKRVISALAARAEAAAAPPAAEAHDGEHRADCDEAQGVGDCDGDGVSDEGPAEGESLSPEVGPDRAEAPVPAHLDPAANAIIASNHAAIAESRGQADVAAEAAMRAARDAVAAGANPETCSALVGQLERNEIDGVAFMHGLHGAVAAASAPVLGTCPRCGRTDVLAKDDGSLTLHDRPDGSACNLAIEPLAEVLGETLNGAPAAVVTTEPTDAVGVAIDCVRSLEPDARKAFLQGLAKNVLLPIVERLTGAKTSGRLSPASAVARILAALAPAAPTSAPDGERASGDAGEGDDAPTGNTEAPATKGDASATRARAAELPPVGTILQNKNARTGEVRAECKVVEAGVEYKGEVFKSLSAAAIAASRDLGNTTKQTSGPKFWGLVAGAPRATTTAKPKALDFDALTKAWDRFRERAEAAATSASADDRARLQSLLAAQGAALAAMAGKLAVAAATETEAA